MASNDPANLTRIAGVQDRSRSPWRSNAIHVILHMTVIQAPIKVYQVTGGSLCFCFRPFTPKVELPPPLLIFVHPQSGTVSAFVDIRTPENRTSPPFHHTSPPTTFNKKTSTIN